MESKLSTESQQVRKRKANKEIFLQTPKGSKIIRLPISESEYQATINDRKLFRTWLSSLGDKYKFLFEEDFASGYILHDIRHSKKMDLFYRRVRFASGNIYAIHPSYVLPYWSGKTTECKHGLLLLLRGTSLDSVVSCYGENQVKWLNRLHQLGRFSLVGTTIKDANLLPKDLTSDEKITFWNGKEVYACITTGNNCILGADISHTEDEAGLKQSYQVFKSEAQNLSPNYQPNSVNTDGWASTRKAWKTLFEDITLILCFLHCYIKLRSISKKEPLKNELFHQVWTAYKAESKPDFIQQIQQIDEWAKKNIQSQTLLIQIEKMKNNAELYATSYDCGGNRTSNMVDRAIKPMDKFLANAQYFHGNFSSAQLTMRALAMGYNFMPFCQRTKFDKKKVICFVEPLI